MDKEKQYKIALVIKTDGLEYDDRVRKEILTIQRLYHNVRFKVFAMLPENIQKEGITDYGVPYLSIYIPSRDKYPSATHLLKKAYQFHNAIKAELKTYDAIWCGGMGGFMTVALANNKQLVWDLHELPLEFLGHKIKRKILSFLFSRCKVVVHANPQRIEYLKGEGIIKDVSKHIALRNYPNFDDVDSNKDEKYYRFIDWKRNRKCVYLQGLSEDRRAAYESVSAILKNNKYVAVVVGKMHSESLERLINEYGENYLRERIYFVGRIEQLKIPQYIAECCMSLVFYKNVQPNNWYCEANRFYQSVMLGLPVVTGSNPSMKELVEKYKIGISIDDDGSDIDKIVNGMDYVMNNYDSIHHNTLKYRNNLLWDNQEDIIKSIVERLFN